ncbi:MAG: phosphotransferase [Candidatus Poseidoniia archaeon]
MLLRERDDGAAGDEERERAGVDGDQADVEHVDEAGAESEEARRAFGREDGESDQRAGQRGFRKVARVLEHACEASLRRHDRVERCTADPDHAEDRSAAREDRATGTTQARAGQEQHDAGDEAHDRAAGLERIGAVGDLHDGNLMRIGSRVGLLDFDMLCVGDAALDLANLSAHLELRALQGIRGASLAGAAACDQALRRGFGQQNCEFARSLEFHRATTFLRIALIYHLRPRWAALTPGLVRLAESCLHEVTLLR